MSTSTVDESQAGGENQRRRRRAGAAKRTSVLHLSNISLVYMYAAGFLLFSLWIPHLWLDGVTQRSILNISFAVPAILAIGLLVPLLAGVFDLSIAGTMDAASVTIGWLLIYHHVPEGLGIILVLLLGALIGVINAVLVAVVGVDSFIATLGTSSILTAFAVWLSGGIQITGFSPGFSSFGSGDLFGGIQRQVLYLAIVAVVAWYAIEHTPVGRYLQATGENQDAARLAGIRTKRYIFISLIISAVMAAFAGVIETSVVGAGESTLGDPYLLTAFAAAFLGATQFKGRFNVWGTVFGVWVLASGVEGVTLALGSYAWLNSLFFGAALIFAVGIGRMVQINNGRVAVRRRAATRISDVASTDLSALAGSGSSLPGEAKDPAVRKRGLKS